jgi:ABC-type transport system involved in multi-copper enzyme maturation permease subunit
MLALFRFTLRQVVWQRKFWLTALVLAMPVALVLLVRAVVFTRTGQFTLHPGLGPKQVWELYHGSMFFLLLMALLPLVCMLYGTALVGAEVENRTFVYLAIRRLSRARVLLVRIVAAWSVLCVLLALAMLVLHATVTLGLHLPAETTWQPQSDLRAYLAVIPLGVAGFLAMFTLVSLLFSRPLIASVIYFGAFELFLGNAPAPARRVSISHPLKLSLVSDIPGLRQLATINTPEAIASALYPAGASGTVALLITIGVLLAAAMLIISWRELAPTKVSRD